MRLVLRTRKPTNVPGWLLAQGIPSSITRQAWCGPMRASMYVQRPFSATGSPLPRPSGESDSHVYCRQSILGVEVLPLRSNVRNPEPDEGVTVNWVIVGVEGFHRGLVVFIQRGNKTPHHHLRLGVRGRNSNGPLLGERGKHGPGHQPDGRGTEDENSDACAKSRSESATPVAKGQGG